MKCGIDHPLYFFTEPVLISRMTTRAVKDQYDKMADLKIDDDFESLMEVDDDKIIDTDLLCSTTERNAALWKWAFLQRVKRALVLPPHSVKTRGGLSSQTLVLPSQAVKSGRGCPEITHHIAHFKSSGVKIPHRLDVPMPVMHTPAAPANPHHSTNFGTTPHHKTSRTVGWIKSNVAPKFFFHWLPIC